MTACVQVIVTGQPFTVALRPDDTVLDLRRRAVAAAGYDEGQYWEVREDTGALVDQTQPVMQVVRSPLDRLFVNLPAGVGA